MTRRNISVLTLTIAALFLTGMAFAQVTDPGVRGGAAGAGQPLASVSASANDLAFFNSGLGQFNESQTVTGDNVGLGPRFNLDSCGGCHAQPATGGSSPAVNPQFTIISRGVASSATNTRPAFIAQNGPVREARFPFFFNPNGGVETIFTIAGRADLAPGKTCAGLTQPSFAQAAAANNLIFRIPTPVFGSGLMANIDDSTLLINQANQAGNAFGVAGAFNHNGNDGTISRFGWKAQNKSLMIFSGE